MPRERTRHGSARSPFVTSPLLEIVALIGIDTARIGHATSFITQIILRCHFPNQGRSEHLVLGNTSQENADGRQIVGRRLPVISSGRRGWKAGLGRFPEWIIHGRRFGSSFLTVDLASCSAAGIEIAMLHRNRALHK